MAPVDLAQHEEHADWHYMADVEDTSDKDVQLDNDDDDDMDHSDLESGTSRAVGSYLQFLVNTSSLLRRRLFVRDSERASRLPSFKQSLHAHSCHCRLRTCATLVLVAFLSFATFRFSSFVTRPYFHHHHFPHHHPHHHRTFDPPWARPALRYDVGITAIPSTFPGAVTPLDCHSHNDYDRKIPLFEALHYGCASVEADVWLLRQETNLLVGHSNRALREERSLDVMYIRPILQMLDQRNPAGSIPRRGISDSEPTRPLVLLVDLKTDGYQAFPALEKALAPLRLRGYLTHFDGERVVDGLVTIVVTGNAPFDLMMKNQTYRDTFFDAPLARIWEDQHQGATAASAEIHAAPEQTSAGQGQGQTGLQGVTNASIFTPENSYFASVSYKEVLNRNIPAIFPPNPKQADMMRQMIEAAHAQGLKARFWSTPRWPVWYRDEFWAVASELGADVLNVDEPRAFQRGFWRHTDLDLISLNDEY